MFEKDLEINYSVMLENKVPILIEDKTWQMLFKNINNKDLIKHKNKLNELIKDKKNFEKKLFSVKKEKRKIMKKIIELSDKADKSQNDIYVDMLEECQNMMVKRNRQLEDLTFKLEMIPTQIRQANYELLKVTIKYAYNELYDCEKDFEYLNEEIEKLKEELRDMIERKNDYREKINSIYTFLHGVLGGKNIDKLDEKMLK